MLRSKYIMAKMVNAIFAYQKTGGVTRQTWHLPCLPYIYPLKYLFATYYLQGASLCNFMLSVTFLYKINFCLVPRKNLCKLWCKTEYSCEESDSYGFDHALAFVSITHRVKVMRGAEQFFGLKYTFFGGWGRGFKNIWLVLGGGGGSNII